METPRGKSRRKVAERRSKGVPPYLRLTKCTVANKRSSAWRKASRPSRQSAAQPHGAKPARTWAVKSTRTRSQTVAFRHTGASAPDRIKTKKTASMTAPLVLKTTLSSTAMLLDQAETTISKPLTPRVACPILRLLTAPPDHSASTAMPPLH